MLKFKHLPASQISPADAPVALQEGVDGGAHDLRSPALQRPDPAQTAGQQSALGSLRGMQGSMRSHAPAHQPLRIVLTMRHIPDLPGWHEHAGRQADAVPLVQDLGWPDIRCR